MAAQRVPGAGRPRWPLGTATSGLRAPWPDALGACLRAGITHLELDLFGDGVDPALPASEGALARMARQIRGAGLTLWSVHLPFGGPWDLSSGDRAARAWAVEQQRRLLTAAAHWGAAVAVVHASAEPIGDGERGPRTGWAVESLAALSQAAAAAGMRLAVECLPRTCLGNSAAEIGVLLAAVPGLAVCCDVNHVFRESPAGFIRAMGPRLATLHISDNDGIDERHWLPGRGCIAWAEVVAALRDVAYGGPVLFEVVPHAPEELAEAARRAGV